MSYLKYWVIQGIICQGVLGQTEYLGKNAHMKNFETDEFVGKDLVRKFSTNLNYFGYWDYSSVFISFFIAWVEPKT